MKKYVESAPTNPRFRVDKVSTVELAPTKISYHGGRYKEVAHFIYFMHISKQ